MYALSQNSIYLGYKPLTVSLPSERINRKQKATYPLSILVGAAVEAYYCWREVYWASYWWLSFYQNILTSQRSRKFTLSVIENISLCAKMLPFIAKIVLQNYLCWDLQGWCGRCRAPPGVPGCWLPSTELFRSPTRGRGSRLVEINYHFAWNEFPWRKSWLKPVGLSRCMSHFSHHLSYFITFCSQ